MNPLTYAVDPLRHVVFAAQNMPPAARVRFPTGVELFGHTLPSAGEIGSVAVFAVVFLSLALHAFGKPEQHQRRCRSITIRARDFRLCPRGRLVRRLRVGRLKSQPPSRSWHRRRTEDAL